MYAELSSSASEDDPHYTVEQFLSIYPSLTKAAVVADSLLKTVMSEGSGGEVAVKVPVDDSQRRASTWVQAALAMELSSFTVYKRAADADKPPMLVLDGSSKKPSPPPQGNIRQPGSLRIAPGSAAATRGKPKAVPPPEWARGEGLEEVVDLAKSLREESRDWFLGFIDQFLNGGVDPVDLSDKSRVATILAQLKRVNDWLEEVGRPVAGSDGEESSQVPAETVDRLRKNIYEYLLTHVESAAVALGGGGGGGGSRGGGGVSAAKR